MGYALEGENGGARPGFGHHLACNLARPLRHRLRLRGRERGGEGFGCQALPRNRAGCRAEGVKASPPSALVASVRNHHRDRPGLASSSRGAGAAMVYDDRHLAEKVRMGHIVGKEDVLGRFFVGQTGPAALDDRSQTGASQSSKQEAYGLFSLSTHRSEADGDLRALAFEEGLEGRVWLVGAVRIEPWSRDLGRRGPAVTHRPQIARKGKKIEGRRSTSEGADAVVDTAMRCGLHGRLELVERVFDTPPYGAEVAADRCCDQAVPEPAEVRELQAGLVRSRNRARVEERRGPGYAGHGKDALGNEGRGVTDPDITARGGLPNLIGERSDVPKLKVCDDQLDLASWRSPAKLAAQGSRFVRLVAGPWADSREGGTRVLEDRFVYIGRDGVHLVAGGDQRTGQGGERLDVAEAAVGGQEDSHDGEDLCAKRG